MRRVVIGLLLCSLVIVMLSGSVTIGSMTIETARITTSSGKLLTDRAYDRKGGLYVFGEGAGRITVETSSGNLKIQ